MKIIIVRDYEEMSARAAEIVDGFIRRNSRVTIGLPTGNTPTGMYRLLVGRHRAQRLDFAGVTTFNLDEYWGLAPDHPASFAWYIRTNFLDHVNIPPGRSHRPSSTGDAQLVCREYEEAVRREGGLDLAILGIGANGHIAFNEPGTPFSARTHVARLTKRRGASPPGARNSNGWKTCPRRASPWGSRPLWRRRRCCCWPRDPPKQKPSPGRWRAPSPRTCPLRCCSATAT